MGTLFAVFLILFLYLQELETLVAFDQPNRIPVGASLSPLQQKKTWISPSGRFSFGFHHYPGAGGGSFSVGICLEGLYEKILVWTANRDDPAVSSNAILKLTVDGLHLVSGLQSGRRRVVAANSSERVSFASLLDNGNLVLYNKQSAVIWESFNFPTDTLLGGQKLVKGQRLLSNKSKDDYSTGRFQLIMQDDGNLVSYPYPNSMNDSDEAYWAFPSFGNRTQMLFLNSSSGELVLKGDNQSKILPRSYDSLPDQFNNSEVLYRAILGFDGVLELLSHTFNEKGNSNMSSKWKNIDDVCKVKGFCGYNSYCTFYDEDPVCKCLPAGYNKTDDHETVCERNFAKGNCERGKEIGTHYKMIDLERITWDDPPYYQSHPEAGINISSEECKTYCLMDCDCDAVFYDYPLCNKYKMPLKYLRRDVLQSLSIASIKVGKLNHVLKIKPSPAVPMVSKIETSKKAWVLVLAISIGFITYSCIAFVISGFFIFKSCLLKYKEQLESGMLGLTEEFTMRSYSYKELVKATNGFKEELGRGSFGAVYKGSFRKGKKIMIIAVKRLEKVIDEGEREFKAEMRVIGRSHHRNLVRLLGYCAERSKRLLVYEYMSNGSLAGIVFHSERRPTWSERVRIALDVARGILYLHEECKAPIIHCDVKPQNILMDDFWNAKISDFGLAKLLMPDQTRTFTGVRGTRGYMAPEWQKNTPISVKVDVYSYGIVLLEIVCCRKNIEVDLSKPEEILLSSWAYKCFTGGNLQKLVGSTEDVDMRSLERLVNLALWCIQDEPELRPTMKTAMLMLEGIIDMPVPPCPTASSI